MATILRKLTIRRIALVDAGANQEAFVNLFKRDGDMADKDTPEAKRLADLEAQVATLTKARADAEKAKADKEKADADVIAKAAEAKKTAEDKAREASDAVVALQKQLATNAEQISKLTEEREIERFTEIAKSVPHLGPSVESVPQLRAIAKALDAKAFDAYLVKQRAIAEQLRQSNLLKEIGGNGDGDGLEFSAKMATLAKQFQAEDKKLTPEQAYVKALEQNPELYDAHRRGSYSAEGGS
jgi:phage-related minor tail protein